MLRIPIMSNFNNIHRYLHHVCLSLIQITEERTAYIMFLDIDSVCNENYVPDCCLRHICYIQWSETCRKYLPVTSGLLQRVSLTIQKRICYPRPLVCILGYHISYGFQPPLLSNESPCEESVLYLWSNLYRPYHVLKTERVLLGNKLIFHCHSHCHIERGREIWCTKFCLMMTGQIYFCVEKIYWYNPSYAIKLPIYIQPYTQYVCFVER